jgi:hypothetical protein
VDFVGIDIEDNVMGLKLEGIWEGMMSFVCNIAPPPLFGTNMYLQIRIYTQNYKNSTLSDLTYLKSVGP